MPASQRPAHLVVRPQARRASSARSARSARGNVPRLRGSRVIYSVIEGSGTRIISAPCDGLTEEHELISLERGFGSLVCTETGDVCLVEQIPQRDPDSWSSADPHDFFWVQKAPKLQAPFHRVEPTFTWAVMVDESQLKIAAITIR
jgi:hypothetical protein